MPQTSIDTRIGRIAIVADDTHVLRLWIDSDDDRSERAESPLLREAAAQLSAWAEGRLTGFDLPLAPARTARGAALRQAIADIPYGETANYGAVAHAAGSGPRAIGQACARNPLPILVPCHRVIGSGGSIGHYSGGRGVATKRLLLAIEEQVSGKEGFFKWVV